MQITKEENKRIKEIISLFQEETLTQCKQYSINNHSKNVNISYKYWASNQMPMNNLTKFNEIVKGIENAQIPNKVKSDLIESLQPTYKAGDIFRGLPKLHYYEDGQITSNTNFDISKDSINILFFWETKNTASHQILQELLKINFDESQNVNILAINIDDDIQVWENQMKKFPKINSYYLDLHKESNRQLFLFLNIIKTPYIIITDNEYQIMSVKNAVKLATIKEEIEKTANIQEQKDEQVLEANEIQNNFPQPQEIVKDKITIPLNQIQSEGIVENLFEITDTVEFKYIQIKQIHKDGKKEIIKKKRLLVSIETDSTQIKTGSIDGLKEYLSSILDHEFLIVKQIINLENEEKQLVIRSVFTDIVQEMGIQVSPFNWQKYEFKWDYYKESFICQSTKEISLKPQIELNPEQYSELNQNLTFFLENLVDESQSQDNDNSGSANYAQKLLKQIQGVKDQGDKFTTITGYLDKNQNIVSISHQKGQVLVIIWLIPCAFTIFKLEKFNSKIKEQYGVQIRFVYLGLNNYQQDIDVVYKVNPTAEFFYPKNADHPSKQQYQVDLFPYQLIIDQRGQIQHRGVVHKLEQKITKLLDQTEKYEDAQINLEQLINFLTVQQLINKSLGDENQFRMSITLETNQQQQLKANVQYLVRERHYVELLAFINQIKTFIPASKLTFQELIMRQTSIPYPGKKCDQCQERLYYTVQQYYNPFQQVFYCTTCGETAINNKYVITDNLIFINTPITNIDELKDIDTYRIGVNSKNDNQTDNRLEFICNGCGCEQNNKSKTRYIVLNNSKGYSKLEGYCDFCEDCFLIIKQKQEKWKQFKEINENSVFLRLTYQRAYNDY